MHIFESIYTSFNPESHYCKNQGEPTKNAMPIVRESWGHVLIIPMKCLNQLLL